MTVYTAIVNYFLLFLFYAVLGWIGESTYVSTAEYFKAKKAGHPRPYQFINRGFLTGPVVPIYGAGGLAMTIFLKPFQGRYLVIFLVGLLVCDTIEFVTSYVMEKLFHARWWDYTGKPGNIQGRIDLLHSIYWGIGSVLYITFIYPPVEKLMGLFSWNVKQIMFWMFLAVFLYDFVTTVIATINIVKIRTQLEKLVQRARELSPEELLTYTTEALEHSELFHDTKDAVETVQFKTKWMRNRAGHIFRSYPRILETLQGHAETVLSHPSPAEVLKQFSFLTLFLQAFARDDKPELL